MRRTLFQIIEKEGNGDGGFSIRDGAETGARRQIFKKKKGTTNTTKTYYELLSFIGARNESTYPMQFTRSE
jgi:hypothetical protein